MDRIAWSDEFSVGVKRFDAQHKRLIGMLNKLIETPDDAANSKLIRDTLYGLIDYATNHLEQEEQFLKDNGFPDFDNHRNHHNDYIDKTANLGDASRTNKAAMQDELIDFLCEWWVNHILKEDMKYKSFAEEKGLT